MATLAAYHGTTFDRTSSLFDPNRPDAIGAAISAVLPLAVIVIVNGLGLMSGWTLPAVQEEALPFAPPPFAVAAIWIAMFPLWGLARWTAWQAGREGRKASWWIVALIVAGLGYPFVAGTLDLFWNTLASVSLLLLAIAAAARVAQVSRAAFLLILPSIAWLGFATVVGFAAIAQGWSPGFAATQQGANGAA